MNIIKTTSKTQWCISITTVSIAKGREICLEFLRLFLASSNLERGTCSLYSELHKCLVDTHTYMLSLVFNVNVFSSAKLPRY